MKLAFGLLALIAVYIAFVVITNRSLTLPQQDIDFDGQAKGLPTASTTITVGTWNLGYAGLGKESDFVVDGGEHFFPPSRKIVAKNIDLIEQTIEGLGTDVQLFQEIAYSGPLSLWKSVARRVEDISADGFYWWRPDVATTNLPWPLRLKHGTAITSRLAPDSGTLTPIVGEPEPFFGMLNRQYGLQVMILQMADGAGSWAIMNVHLSAFDDGGDLRRQQIKAVFDHAQSLFEQGHHVIIGGDWNMELAKTDFPHTTAEKDLFWIHPFPEGALPEGWNFAIDPALPTVRTDHKPFVAGENYTTIIDGFVVSPNVSIETVHTIDTGFEMSDHMPVIGTFRAQ